VGLHNATGQRPNVYNVASAEPNKSLRSTGAASLMCGEILDLVAYLYSRGNRNHPMFRRGKE
jgi:hypothetical protein